MTSSIGAAAEMVLLGQVTSFTGNEVDHGRAKTSYISIGDKVDNAFDIIVTLYKADQLDDGVRTSYSFVAAVIG